MKRHACSSPSRCAVADPRAAAATTACPAERWQAARSGTCRPDWHPVRAAHRHRMGDAPQGDGVRLGGDLLAPIAGLAGGGRLGPIASRVAPAAARCRPHRLEQSLHRQLVGRGEKGGAATGPNPTDRGRPARNGSVATAPGAAALTATIMATCRCRVGERMVQQHGLARAEEPASTITGRRMSVRISSAPGGRCTTAGVRAGRAGGRTRRASGAARAVRRPATACP